MPLKTAHYVFTPVLRFGFVYVLDGWVGHRGRKKEEGRKGWDGSSGKEEGWEGRGKMKGAKQRGGNILSLRISFSFPTPLLAIPILDDIESSFYGEARYRTSFSWVENESRVFHAVIRNPGTNSD